MKYKPSTFIVIPSKYRLSEVDAVAQAIFLWLCDHADRNTGKCFPGIKRLSMLCKFSENTIRDRIKKLERSGLIKKTTRKNENGTNMSNEYQIIIDESIPQKRGGSNPAPHTSLNEPSMVQEKLSNQIQFEQKSNNKSGDTPALLNFYKNKLSIESTEKFLCLSSESLDHISKNIHFPDLTFDEIKQEIEKFILYWTEPNQTKLKQRWQLQPTFHIPRRLFMWFTKIHPRNRSKGVVI